MTAVRRHVGQAGADTSGDGRLLKFAAVEPDRARGRGPQARKRLHEFELTVAVNAGDSADFSSPDLKRKRPHAPSGEAVCAARSRATGLRGRPRPPFCLWYSS